MMQNYEIERPGQKIMPTLLSLLSRFDKRYLPRFIKRRGISIPAGAPIYALIDHDVDHVDQETVRQSIQNILRFEGFGITHKVTQELKMDEQFVSYWPRGATLYQVNMD